MWVLVLVSATCTLCTSFPDLLASETMSIFVLLASFSFKLVKQTVGSGVIFTECDVSQCGGKEPIYPPLESSNVSFRMECLIRCLEHTFCGFVGHKEEQCHLYYSTNPTYGMQASAEEWQFWTRRKPVSLSFVDKYRSH